MTLVDFTSPDSTAAWRAVGDVVMGGVSASRLEVCPGGAAFAGTVSLECGGGFASIRAGPRSWPAAGADAFALTVRGDGRRYKFTLRTDDGFDGIQYQASFAASPAWQRVVLPASGFVASFRGRPLSGVPALDSGKVRTLGLMIAERQAGHFRLELARIEALVMPPGA